MDKRVSDEILELERIALEYCLQYYTDEYPLSLTEQKTLDLIEARAEIARLEAQLGREKYAREMANGLARRREGESNENSAIMCALGEQLAAADATLEFTERVQNAVAMELNEWGIAKHKAPLVANFILNRIKTAMQCDAK